jgi:hypothetical protein
LRCYVRRRGSMLPQLSSPDAADLTNLVLLDRYLIAFAHASTPV